MVVTSSVQHFSTYAVLPTYATTAPIYNVVVTPNPFTPNNDGWFDSVKFNFTLQDDLVGKKITIKVFDVTGAEVWTTATDALTNGQSIVWDGTCTGTTQTVPGGVYIFVITMDKYAYKGAVAVAR